MMIRKTAAAFFVGALIAGSAQAAFIFDYGDEIDTSPSTGTVYDYLCPRLDGGVLLTGLPFSLPPAPDCIAFGGTTGLVWSVTDYPLIYDGYDVTLNNDLPSTSSSYSSSAELFAISNDVVRVPEPQTLAIFLTGLGLIGLMAGGRKK